MQILSWNINGLKACLKSDFFDFIYDLLPDIICLQEIRNAGGARDHRRLPSLLEPP